MKPMKAIEMENNGCERGRRVFERINTHFPANPMEKQQLKIA